MESVIEDLFYGRINHCERKRPRSQKAEGLVRSILRDENEILHSLDAEQRALYENIVERETELGEISELEFFAEGLKLGLRLASEVFSDK